MMFDPMVEAMIRRRVQTNMGQGPASMDDQSAYEQNADPQSLALEAMLGKLREQRMGAQGALNAPPPGPSPQMQMADATPATMMRSQQEADYQRGLSGNAGVVLSDATLDGQRA